MDELEPLNLYGKSKQVFDQWLLEQPNKGVWAGFKFFNVYGERENYKGHMASKVHKGFMELNTGDAIALFRSSKPGMDDGGERRDFVYVGDVVKVLCHFLNKNDASISDIYNLGTGKAQSFLQLAQAVFSAKEVKEKINWIDMPEKLKGKYQYFTEANIAKLRKKAGYSDPFANLQSACSQMQELTSKKPYGSDN
jgi:ADP-L-glycero-D-manno-heptose 6-epimerase